MMPGRYKIDISIRDVATGNKGVTSIAFEVPKYDETKLSTSTLIIASKLRPTGPQDIGEHFTIGSAKVVPNVLGKFKKGQEVGLLIFRFTTRASTRPHFGRLSMSSTSCRQMEKRSFAAKEDWSGLSDPANGSPSRDSSRPRDLPLANTNSRS